MTDKITQADRDAAASVALYYNDDHFFMKMLAAHRLAGERAGMLRAAGICEEQREVYLSPEYATGQPLSSFQERFACGQCAEAIRAKAQADG